MAISEAMSSWKVRSDDIHESVVDFTASEMVDLIFSDDFVDRVGATEGGLEEVVVVEVVVVVVEAVDVVDVFVVVVEVDFEDEETGKVFVEEERESKEETQEGSGDVDNSGEEIAF